jgi:multidrug efflux pump subunit AcrA (membrane-fusion protein)
MAGRSTFMSRGLPLLALVLLVAAIVSVVLNRPSRPLNEPASMPPTASGPGARKAGALIAGSGLVEARDRNVAISTPVSGVVDDVRVTVGERVARGDVLFTLDTRELASQLRSRLSGAAASRARIGEAQAGYDRALGEVRRAESLDDPRALAREEVAGRRASLATARATLAAARADARNSEMQAAEVRTDIARRTVRAPSAGQVLQLNVRPGEFAGAAANATPLVLIGDTSLLSVRVDVDENDAPRLSSTLPAVGYLRGAPHRAIPLTFAYVEPYVQPKTSLTGAAGERVDTRVLQVVYRFAPSGSGAFIGQQMDVFIGQRPQGRRQRRANQ